MKNLHIVSYSSEPFKDRVEAGSLLAKELKKRIKCDAIVLGIPRGGVVIAKEIAKILSVEMDIVLSRKIGAPFNPEYAIGAVSEDGKVFINQEVPYEVGVNDGYIKKEKELKRKCGC